MTINISNTIPARSQNTNFSIKKVLNFNVQWYYVFVLKITLTLPPSYDILRISSSKRSWPIICGCKYGRFRTEQRKTFHLNKI